MDAVAAIDGLGAERLIEVAAARWIDGDQVQVPAVDSTSGDTGWDGRALRCRSFGLAECLSAELGHTELVPDRVEAPAELIIVERDVVPDGWHEQERYRVGLVETGPNARRCQPNAPPSRRAAILLAS